MLLSLAGIAPPASASRCYLLLLALVSPALREIRLYQKTMVPYIG